LIDNPALSNAALVGENARRDDVNQPWEQDNQAWWDWYVTLADNSDEPPIGQLQDIDPLPPQPLPSDEDIVEELRTPYPDQVNCCESMCSAPALYLYF
jgi:hypothetical protein